MTPEIWERLKELYEPALEMSEEGRAQFVAEVDPALRAELIRLLAASSKGSITLDAPILEFHDLSHTQEHAFREGDLLLGRFRIVRLLGSGGMGQVYEAIDVQLGRIALKTIVSDITSSPEQLLRFRKEVLLARSVSNPHVLRIHELFLTDGPQGAFVTMEFLEGITLADKLRESGPLPWSEAKIVALEICIGLESIHEAGIIHRDLKGRNIMLAWRNGIACTVLMDFGIARRISLSSDDSTAITRSGTILGTPGYMAPEQAEGKEATPASDVYALGLVFYELVTGKRPFANDFLAESHLGKTKPLARPSSLQPEVPRRFDDIVCKCLEYDPKRRYQSVKEVERAIRTHSMLLWIREKPWSAAAWIAGPLLLLLGLMLVPAVGERVTGILFSSREKHIAVLPLDLVGGDAEAQALGDGLMDSLAGKIANLDAANPSLFVVPASEVRSRKVSNSSSAMREFGATIVVEGSFERNAQEIRLKLTLIDPRKTREIGYVDVDSRTGDIAALQDEAVIRLGRLMNISLQQDPVRASREPATRAAFEDYLAGLGYFQRHDKPGNIELAIESLQKAVKTDPTFALGFARLAQVYHMRYRLDSNPESLRLAEESSLRAAELDERIPSTYVALGQIHEMTGKHDLAIHEYQRAISLDPKDVEALSGIGYAYQNAGRIADAETAYRKAAALRPNDWKGYNDLGTFYQQIGRPRDAILQFEHAIVLTPDNSWPYANLGMTYLDSDDPAMLEKAETALKQSIAISPTFGAYSNLGQLYSSRHRFQESIAANQAAIRLNDQNYEVWGNLMAAYEWLKDYEHVIPIRQKTLVLVEREVKLNPQDPYPRATLAVLYAKNGEREKALESIKISLALTSNNKYVLSEVADAYESLGNRKDAITFLRRAIAQGLSRESLNADPDMQGVLSDPNLKLPVI